ncbi:MAG: ABC transporter permease [Oscillospiraceae bacterium]
MRFSEIVRMVLVNIFANKVKVLLTSLGIIVGAATIVLVIAVGLGGQAEVADQFANLSAGAIDITYERSDDSTGSSGFGGGGMPSGGGMAGGGGTMPSGGAAAGGKMPSGDMAGGMGGIGGGMGGFTFENTENITLSAEDAEDIALFVPNITNSTISATGKTTVTGGDLEEETEYSIAGVVASFADVSNLTVQIGEFITDDNNTESEKVCVIGATVATEIFGSAYEAYDSVLNIDGRSYVVNGVLQSMGSVTSGISPDTTIFVPFSTSEKYILGTDFSPQITAVTSDLSGMDAVITNIEAVLAENYPKATFTITDAGSKMEAATASANTLATLLLAVAVIVFVVGGIGIMNVLFVSVQERTPEIGVLRAVGCGRRDILLEFLVEGNLISVLGGVLGVGVGYLLIPLVQLAGMRMEPSPIGAVAAFVFAVFTGTIFGFYPALKASKLEPVQALAAGE